MKALRTKANESFGDVKEEKVPRKAAKAKKETELGKLASSTQQKELSEFVDQMANTIKEFEKMDPSLKNIIRDIFTDKPEASSSSRSLSNKTSKPTKKSTIVSEKPNLSKSSVFTSGVKANKFNIESITEVDKHREQSAIKFGFQKDQNPIEKKTILSNSGQKLQQEYKYVIGYHGRWNAVKAFKLLKDDMVFFIRASNLIMVQNKINIFVTDGSHKGSLVILYCIMNSIPIIKIDWITESMKVGNILDPQDFKLDIYLEHKIFDKLSISIYKESNKNKQGIHSGEGEIALLEEAVKKFGGTLKSNFNDTDYLVVIDSYFERFTNSKNRKESSLQNLVNYKWVVDCILENFKKNPINPVYEVKKCN